MADGLYELDYYAWTQQQAEMLRKRGCASNALDYENLAGEIEDMGRSQERACESQIRNILLHFLKLHFLKLQFVRDRTAERHWRKEIAAFRIELQRDLTPTLRGRLPKELASLYAEASKLFLLDFDPADITGMPPQDSPFDWDDMLGRDADWTPDAA